MQLHNEIARNLQINIRDFDDNIQIKLFEVYEIGTEKENRECIEILLKALHYLQRYYEEKHLEEKDRLKILNLAYDHFYRDFGKIIGHYFRTMFIILEFIEDSVISKEFYSNILRAQLSKYELGLLFYNCLSKYGREKMLPLVEKYKLLKHLESNDVLTSSSDRSLINNVLLTQHLNLTLEQ